MILSLFLVLAKEAQFRILVQTIYLGGDHSSHSKGVGRLMGREKNANKWCVMEWIAAAGSGGSSSLVIM